MDWLNDPQYEYKLFDGYVVNATVPANGTITPTLQIDTDADFVLTEILGSRTSDALTIEVSEAAAGGLPWQSAPVNIDNFMGTRQLPNALLVPQLMPRKRTYSFRFVDTSGAPNVVQLVLSGYKRFAKRAA